MSYSLWGRKESDMTERLSTAQISSYKSTFSLERYGNNQQTLAVVDL